jgi:hypothetical protein
MQLVYDKLFDATMKHAGYAVGGWCDSSTPDMRLTARIAYQ